MSNKVYHAGEFKPETTNEIRVKSEFIENFLHETNLSIDKNPCCYSPITATTATPSTILITNNFPKSSDDQQQNSGIQKNNNNSNNSLNNSSITIVTHNNPINSSELSNKANSINICINNHFGNNETGGASALVNNQQSNIPMVKIPNSVADKFDMSENNLTETDSSSTCSPVPDEGVLLNPKFKNGQDVLVQRKDNRFYLGTITAMSSTQCLIKFDDLSLYWANFDELTNLNLSNSDNQPVCVACKNCNGKDVVELCENCGRGYHPKCAGGIWGQLSKWNCPR